MSSIPKPQLSDGSARRLGQEIRARRANLRLSQAAVARPMTRAYVSAIENGQCVPSLSALLLIAQRLNTTAAELLAAVNPELAALYTDRDASHQGSTSS